MGALLDLYMTTEKLELILKTLKSKQQKGVALTIEIKDQSNDYGQNVASWVSQSKEERDAKKERFFTGNGKVFYIKEGIKLAEKKQAQANDVSDQKDDSFIDQQDLPF